MSRLQVTLHAIQHVAHLHLDVDLSKSGLMCLVGRNGAGKTTLVRALRNLSNSDTFVRTATPYAFSEESRIVYDLDGERVTFTYNNVVRSLDCREKISKELRELVDAELPMPYGARFNYFRSASEADQDIRTAIAFGTHDRPEELISFLNAVYETERYSAMVEVRLRGKSYYAFVREDGTYIREDYLSSGEHFLINLFRTIKGPSKLLVIDEIDLSLDAAAQANLPGWLRGFCALYECKILFTTHSLALMQQLEIDELFYMEDEAGSVSIKPISFSHATLRLFGFIGYDRYIATEDKKLVALVHHLVKKYCPTTLLSYKVIYIGGASQVAGLIESNESDGFLAAPEKVIAILDGDQLKEKHAQNARIHMIPLKSVEKALWAARQEDPDFPFVTPRDNFTSEKDFENYLKDKKIATQEQIFDYLIARHEAGFQPIAQVLNDLLPPPHC
ncbi:ATP-dependent nuclease [Xanthomonas vesicatoria]|uniref:ATP-binding protein n=1 Tax=Xanthomonas vesicatoria TaxID=56460 RepID=A0AAJ0N4A8_9XANT|nr:AAA family ATPase [Xanthomonas vesicatoria]APO93564.1 sulfate transporter [Xanthomonas vesicatoria]KHM94306.1 sulfate transporter [Xanthomonas vesicatoria]KHM95191.1 sulfate transporter [Xanthomonas vesicatoria]MCC8624607.1 ATP-binding protein [Xanthomonas vesicatoria]MCC8695271.1 ATP-binding protein [Xanthomonas vesicatoria]